MKQLREIHVKTLEGGVKKIYGQQFHLKMVWNGEKFGRTTFLTP